MGCKGRVDHNSFWSPSFIKQFQVWKLELADERLGKIYGARVRAKDTWYEKGQSEKSRVFS